MQRLHEALTLRADRGTPVGADTMIERVAAELRGQEAPQVVAFLEGGHETTTQTKRREEATRPTPPRRPRWRAGLAFGAAFILVLAAVGVVAPLLDRGEEVADTTTVTVTTAPSTTDAPTTTAEPITTSAPATPRVIPALGEGWEIVLSTRPGDSPSLREASVSITDVGYYVETFGNNKYLMRRDDNAGNLVDIEIPGSGGFATAGTGVVAWTNVGPESLTEAQLWVSSDGINFERVAHELLAGCAGTANCQGTEIYAAAAAPSGRVVALAYDPVVWKPECDCYELNPVALVSDDGREWTRVPLDLLSVLPAEWQGAADIRGPLVYVEGRWLTYATHYYNNGYTTDTALFTSDNGIDWHPVDTGDFFDETNLFGMAANDRGVVALTREAAYWSADGSEWTRTTLTDREDARKVAAYDDGYVAVSSPRTPEGVAAPIDTMWYSADGTTWSRMTLQLEEATEWNAIVGDGPNLMAVGVTYSNLSGIWRWSG
jgi:hypothetical protein